MDIKKLNPWNWFGHEEEQSRNLTVQRSASQGYHPLMQLHHDIDRMFGNINDILGGILTDRIGRRHVMIGASACVVLVIAHAFMLLNCLQQPGVIL